MGIEESAILESLRAVKDPDLNRDIVSLGFVKNLKIGSELSEAEQSGRLCTILEREIEYLNQQVESKDKQMHLTQLKISAIVRQMSARHPGE